MMHPEWGEDWNCKTEFTCRHSKRLDEHNFISGCVQMVNGAFNHPQARRRDLTLGHVQSLLGANWFSCAVASSSIAFRDPRLSLV